MLSQTKIPPCLRKNAAVYRRVFATKRDQEASEQEELDSSQK